MDTDTKKGFMIAFVLLSLAVVVFAGLSVWAYGKYTSERDTADNRAAQAVQQAESDLEEKLQAEFTETQKQPFRTYKSSAELGSIEIGYPKSWSGFFNDVQTRGQELSFVAHPSEVRTDTDSTFYAFQLRLVDSPYGDVLNTYDKFIEEGDLEASPYTLPSVEDSVGIKLTGRIEKEVTGEVILIKFRDKTIITSTESPDFIPDFEEIVNEHLTFLP